MEAWRQWQEMARESSGVARRAEASGGFRSATSRYYYAAYQVASALSLYQGMAPPQGREAWSHTDTPRLIRNGLGPLIKSRDQRSDLARRLERLYKIRIIADYTASSLVGIHQINAVRKDSGFILKAADRILPEG